MNIAILGCGSIAEKMATTLQPLKNVVCYAVASRDKNKAQIFADRHGFHVAYGSYEDMLLDPNVHLVYIATPHSHHYEHIKLCLKHNKHVLCEKAFTANARQAEEVLRLAESKGLLLTEAIWTRYMPMRKIINDVVKSGIIGNPTSLSCNLGYPLEHVERMVKPELCGGALLDLGVYVLNFASMVFGNDIESMAATCIKYPSGVDAQETIMLTYKDGKMASLYATMLAQTDRRGLINGTNGYIEVENINNPESITVYNLEHRIVAQYAAPTQVTGYEYEVQSAMNAIMEGQIECPEMPHYETLLMMQLMDNIRAAWGIRFPYEVEKVESDPDTAEIIAARKAEAERKARERGEELDEETGVVKEKITGSVRLVKETGQLNKEDASEKDSEEADKNSAVNSDKDSDKDSALSGGLKPKNIVAKSDDSEDDTVAPKTAEEILEKSDPFTRADAVSTSRSSAE